MKHFENNVAYIDGWLKRLRGDKRFIVFGSSKAQKAVDYILDTKFTDVQEAPEPAEAEVN